MKISPCSLSTQSPESDRDSFDSIDRRQKNCELRSRARTGDIELSCKFFLCSATAAQSKRVLERKLSTLRDLKRTRGENLVVIELVKREFRIAMKMKSGKESASKKKRKLKSNCPRRWYIRSFFFAVSATLLIIISNGLASERKPSPTRWTINLITKNCIK